MGVLRIVTQQRALYAFAEYYSRRVKIMGVLYKLQKMAGKAGLHVYQVVFNAVLGDALVKTYKIFFDSLQNWNLKMISRLLQ